MKRLQDFRILENHPEGRKCALLILEPLNHDDMSDVVAGQFVEVLCNTPGVMLRRPISVNMIDRAGNRLWLLVRRAGTGTDWLASLVPGDIINIMLPLGNGFSIPPNEASRVLLVGGGVGVAPLLELGIELKKLGHKPEFLIGAQTESDILEYQYFTNVAPVHISTDDGSQGSPGFVTANPILIEGEFEKIYCCGPSPMMKAVAKIACNRLIDCEVSLENMMACGLGACLCCVEKTVKGNVCVCTEGPVFNINQLTWQI